MWPPARLQEVTELSKESSMARRALAAVAVVGIAAVGLTACSGSKDKAAS